MLRRSGLHDDQEPAKKGPSGSPVKRSIRTDCSHAGAGGVAAKACYLFYSLSATNLVVANRVLSQFSAEHTLTKTTAKDLMNAAPGSDSEVADCSSRREILYRWVGLISRRASTRTAAAPKPANPAGLSIRRVDNRSSVSGLTCWTNSVRSAIWPRVCSATSSTSN